MGSRGRLGARWASVPGFQYLVLSDLVQYRTVAVSGPISYLQLGADVYMY